MKKGIKIFVCILLMCSLLCGAPAYASYNAVFENDVKDNGGTIYAQTYLLVSLDNDAVIFEKNADKRTAPASLTKIAAAAVVLENCRDLDEVVEMGSYPLDLLLGTGSSVAGLMAGERMSVRNLLYCMLVRSGNDAANVLAEHIGGSIETFVSMMNELAARLGCTDTHFVNAHGLDDPNHYSTARDLIIITKHALTLPHFEQITSTATYTVPATNLSPQRNLYTTNYLMNRAYADYYSPYASGIKTGSTQEAGRCVISKGSGNGYNYLCVVMNAPFMNIDDDELPENCAFVDCKLMFNWVFTNIELQPVASPTQIVGEIPLKLSFDRDYISLVPLEEVLALVPRGTDSGGVLIEPVEGSLPEQVDAPVEKGQQLGQARVMYAGEEIARINLVASESVSRSTLLFIGSIIKNAVSSTAFKIIAGVLAALLAAYIILFIYVNYKRRQKRKLKIVRPQAKSSGEYAAKKGKKNK